MDYLNTDIQSIKGVGPNKAKAMNRLGIFSLGDLISYFPRKYEDRRIQKKVSEILDGDAVCCELVISSEPKLSHIRKGMDIVRFDGVDETGKVKITFFNQKWVKGLFRVGETLLFYGKFTRKGNSVECANPIHGSVSSGRSSLKCIMPIYSLTSGITQNNLQNAVRQGLDACHDVYPEIISPKIRSEFNLASDAYAFENIHFPIDEHALKLARNTLVFEECYVLSCAQQSIRRHRTTMEGRHMLSVDGSEFEEKLPFALTDAQKKVISQSFSDLISGEYPMNRLVQGDVGSGKTVVAAACCWLCARSGFQSAVLAPTEILAEQHYKTFRALLGAFGIRVGLLTGNMGKREKQQLCNALRERGLDVVVGTHALLSDSVVFSNLALCVVDEQHRFGVVQRAALTQKGLSPHILVMSATPIPRTLALMIYGDLDISVIDELPSGRQAVETFAVKEHMRTRIYAFARKQVAEGRQVYWICPMVDKNEEISTLKSAQQLADEFKYNVFPDLSVGLLHGKMKAKEKEEVMSEFVKGDISILVATTVVEVGVDVSNAALIVIEDADRFGLSQLHQLRGRVGRGKHKSYCILFNQGEGCISEQRLQTMCKTNNGFVIAETDLKLRGPGDFLGARQHGLPEMKIADIVDDVDILSQVRKAAECTISNDPELDRPEHSALKSRVEMLLQSYAGGMN